MKLREKKNVEINKWNTTELQNTFQTPNICVIRKHQGDRGGIGKVFEEIMPEKFQNSMKTKNPQIQEAQ